jgi:Rha family phage regulatory protein
VAATFGKEHAHVLRDIRDLNCSANFAALNFQGSKYEGENGRSQPCYEMTRDGFTRLVMSFTGEKAGVRRETAAISCGKSQLRSRK